MATLYEIEAGLFKLLQLASDPDTTPLDQEQFRSEADELARDRDVKLASISSYIKNLESDAEALKVEAERLRTMRERKLKRVEWLKKYVEYCEPNLSKWSNGIHKLSFLTSTAAVPTEDNPEGKAPEQYATIKTVVAPDKKLIKQVISEGGNVPGWRIESRKNLQVK